MSDSPIETLDYELVTSIKTDLQSKGIHSGEVEGGLRIYPTDEEQFTLVLQVADTHNIKLSFAHQTLREKLSMLGVEKRKLEQANDPDVENKIRALRTKLLTEEGISLPD